MASPREEVLLSLRHPLPPPSRFSSASSSTSTSAMQQRSSSPGSPAPPSASAAAAVQRQRSLAAAELDLESLPAAHSAYLRSALAVPAVDSHRGEELSCAGVLSWTWRRQILFFVVSCFAHVWERFGSRSATPLGDRWRSSVLWRGSDVPSGLHTDASMR